MKPLDRVRTANGRMGLVERVYGRQADVMFSEGRETLDVDDLSPLSATPADALLGGHAGDAQAYGLRLQSLFLRHAYRFDPRSGLSNARIEPNLYQIYIAHLVTNKLQPRMILADEVGLGKTIEAGLVLKELRARGVVDRVLIVTPASLQYQWQTELRSKFNEEFEIINTDAAKYLSQGGRRNPFLARNNVICSLPFAANDRTKPPRPELILEADWDLVIFDEAHRVRRWRPGGTKVSTTKAYDLADELKELVDGLLLLTATPMQLDPFELYSLIELVEPGLYADFRSYDQSRKLLPKLNELMKGMRTWETLSAEEQRELAADHAGLLKSVSADMSVEALRDPQNRDMVMNALVERHPLAGVMVRNRKSVLGNSAGREASRISVELTDEERQLFLDIAEYLRHEYDAALIAKNNPLGFLMVIYQKMLASSSYAIHQSLKRRVEKLRKQRAGGQKAKGGPPPPALDELREELEPSAVVEAMGAVESSYSAGAVQFEIDRIEDLVARLAKVEDSKAARLLEALDRIFEHNPDEKVLIFTQFKDTQDYLRRQIGTDYRVAIFNGSISAEDKEEAVQRFRRDSQIMISTEAGGEGRNIQFAHILVNYDLPWNPMKVEQRIGRLDRIGQKKKVFIYNLACEGTIEERVLDVLEHRINLFTESVGSLDPILGEIETEFERLVMRQRDRFDLEFAQLDEDLERRMREAREKERIFSDLVLDRASFRKDQVNELLGERPLASHEDLASFVENALTFYGGSLMPHVEGGHTVTLSPKLATRLRASTKVRRGVFAPLEALAHENLDFFAMGHELIDAIVELPDRADLDPSVTCVRAIPGMPTSPMIELWYEVKGDTQARFGTVIRHLVDEMGVVQSEVVITMPELGSPAYAPVPPWAGSAIAASRDHHRSELEAARTKIRHDFEERQIEEATRAERIFSYRRTRLRNRIATGTAWIEDVKRTGSEKQRKILPARQGKVVKDGERLAQLQSQFDQELSEIVNRNAVVSSTLWAVGVLVDE
jgi:superfamily II DNA or RNA helicase